MNRFAEDAAAFVMNGQVMATLSSVAMLLSCGRRRITKMLSMLVVNPLNRHIVTQVEAEQPGFVLAVLLRSEQRTNEVVFLL